VVVEHSTVAGSSRLAAVVAERIVADVSRAGWPVGEVLGSEAELLERYGVSRAVLREAVRLLEHKGVATTRRGPGGGLVVTEPGVDAIIDAAVLYLHRVGARLDDVLEARLVVEDVVVRLAPGRLDDRHRRLLEAHVRGEVRIELEDPRAVHRVLAEATGNPALVLFVDILTRLSQLYFDARAVTTRTLEASGEVHARIVRSVLDGDVDAARRRMHAHVTAEAAFVRRRRSARQSLDPSVAIGAGAGTKRGEEVARAIFAAIAEDDLRPGDLVGSELELIERYEVSRAVVREAARLLEHHAIASMRRGPRGGLVVMAPSADAVTDVLALYLERNGIDAAAVFELRNGLEVGCVPLVLERMDGPAARRLRDALDLERRAEGDAFTEAAHDLHAVITSVAGNQVLQLLCVVLIRLCRLHEVLVFNARGRERVGPEVTHAHEAIVSALLAGDEASARRRVQRHMEALAPYFR
jgi:DNA-binding FadR family transcriptional regulator